MQRAIATDENTAQPASERSSAPQKARAPKGPFAAALAAYRAAERVAEELSRAHSYAEEAAVHFPNRVIIPAPPGLTVHMEPMTLIRSGKAREIEATAFTYKTRNCIQTSGLLSDEDKARLVAILEEWQAEQRQADVKSGYNKVQFALDDARDRVMAAYRKAKRAALAVLRAPTASPADLRTKAKIIAELFDGGDEETTKALLHAAKREAPPSPRAFEKALNEWTAARSAYDAAAARADELHERYCDACLTKDPAADALKAALNAAEEESTQAVERMDRAIEELARTPPATEAHRWEKWAAITKWTDAEPDMVRQALDLMLVGSSDGQDAFWDWGVKRLEETMHDEVFTDAMRALALSMRAEGHTFITFLNAMKRATAGDLAPTPPAMEDEIASAPDFARQPGFTRQPQALHA